MPVLPFEACLDSPGQAISVRTSGEARSFENEFFEGAVFVAHRPPADSSDPFEYGGLLARRGDPIPLWEIQIQGRFKVAPKGFVFFGFELWDGPMQLGLVTRALCKVIIKFGTSLAKRRGIPFRHSFGSSRPGDKPVLAFPVLGADRIFVSETPVALPIEGSAAHGAWKLRNGSWEEIDKKGLGLETDLYYTFLFATGHLDWNNWSACGLPGIKTLDLEQFWGRQPAHVVLFEELDERKNVQRLLFELRLSRCYNGSKRQSIDPPVKPQVTAHVANTTMPLRQPSVVETAVEPEEAEVPEEDLSSTFSAGSVEETAECTKEGASENLVESSAVSTDITEEAEAVGENVALEVAEVAEASEGRPLVGSRVRVVLSGRVGTLIIDDGSDFPFKVKFDDGILPFADWFKDDCIVMEKTRQHLAPAELTSVCEGEDHGVQAQNEVHETDSAPAPAPEVLDAPAIFESTSVTVVQVAPQDREFDDTQGGSDVGDDDVNDMVWSPSFDQPIVVESVGLAHKESLLEIAARLESHPGDSDEDKASWCACAEHLFGEPEDVQVTMPWYFRSENGFLWWCLCLDGRLCWRAHEHIMDLVRTIASDEKELSLDLGSAQGLEQARRTVARLLARGRHMSGLLHQFCSHRVSFAELLNSYTPPKPWEEVGIVEAEGCIIERKVTVISGRLAWHDRESGKFVGISLRSATVFSSEVAEAPAVLLSTHDREFILALGSPEKVQRLRRQIALAKKARMNGSFDATNVVNWTDAPLRWPKSRIVLNNRHLCLEPSPDDAVTVSAKLLRKAIEAQDEGKSGLDNLAQTSSLLKCVALDSCSPQEIWSFWVNVFHALLVHATLAVGKPVTNAQIVQFYNRTSYIVSGHPFSLAEVEHTVLRCKMSKPYSRLGKFFLKAWLRSDEDLELRPCLDAPECPASAFRCRPDWRLNLVLSAGNFSSSGSVPIFEQFSGRAFDKLVTRAMHETMTTVGSVGSTVVLPYTLQRYRGDAPLGLQGERSEFRWARALLKETNSKFLPKVVYSANYGWRMRDRLDVLVERTPRG